MKASEPVASGAGNASKNNRGIAILCGALLLAGAIASRFSVERNTRIAHVHAAQVMEARHAAKLRDWPSNFVTRSTTEMQSRDDRLLTAALRKQLEALSRSADPHQRVLALQLLLLSDRGGTPVASRSARRPTRLRAGVIECASRQESA